MASRTSDARNRMRAAGGGAVRGVLIALIHVYRAVASVFPKGACRFEPSCSSYALEAVRVHGARAGGWLAVKRILRCRPGGGFGVDPVPPACGGHGAEPPAGPGASDRSSRARRAAG